MAKIDELAELLVDELNDFKAALDKLQEVNRDLQSKPLKPDTSDMDKSMRDFISLQGQMFKEHQKSTFDLSRKLGRSNSYPNWFIALFLIFLMAFFTITGVCIYRLDRISDTNTMYFKKGQESVMEHFNTFLIERPEIDKAFQEWQTNQNK